MNICKDNVLTQNTSNFNMVITHSDKLCSCTKLHVCSEIHCCNCRLLTCFILILSLWALSWCCVAVAQEVEQLSDNCRISRAVSSFVGPSLFWLFRWSRKMPQSIIHNKKNGWRLRLRQSWLIHKKNVKEKQKSSINI